MSTGDHISRGGSFLPVRTMVNSSWGDEVQGERAILNVIVYIEFKLQALCEHENKGIYKAKDL